MTLHSFRSVARLSALALALAVMTLARAAELSAEVAQKIDDRVTAAMTQAGVPGISIALVRDGQVVLERGYGLADVENDVKASEQTVYRLASISKMLTGVAVMQLVEQGKIDLAAPIQTYLPDFPEKQAPITCELLLKHQSGIRHYRGNETKSAIAYRRVSDSFGVFKDDPLLFTPGERFSYTTYGFNVLGAVVEKASGNDFVSYVQKNIAEPAGMTSLRPDRPDVIIPHRAAGYRREGTAAVSVLKNDFAVDVSNKIPGGGWCSTPGDLARFAIALFDARLVSKETLERMWTAQKTATGKETDCGLGCFVNEHDGERRVFHSGGQPKVSTFLMIAPDQRMAAALMCNLSSAPLKAPALTGELLDVMRD